MLVLGCVPEAIPSRLARRLTLRVELETLDVAKLLYTQMKIKLFCFD